MKSLKVSEVYTLHQVLVRLETSTHKLYGCLIVERSRNFANGSRSRKDTMDAGALQTKTT